MLQEAQADQRAAEMEEALIETVQPTFSYKIRGATNKILSLTEEEKRRGVVAFSSGNHAQAVALAAGEAVGAGHGRKGVAGAPDQQRGDSQRRKPPSKRSSLAKSPER